METTGKSIIGLNVSLKRARDDMSPLKEKLIADMRSGEVKRVKCGEKDIQLVEKKSRPPLGMKKIMILVKDELGAEAALKLQAAMDKARKPPKVSHSVKIVDPE